MNIYLKEIKLKLERVIILKNILKNYIVDSIYGIYNMIILVGDHSIYA